ncbi:hypothetical protein [Blastococcus sp. CCUG 61487]|uniref:hypothetical protein n=1 Tax=Blastococcus sp. CCUG 61487 TaxID=1840703 RepID=UPI0014854C31|nr:hypothetical protein [Blastococcus sp. CCUG 61487]
MAIVITAGTVWALLAAPLAVVIGRSIRLADETAQAPLVADDVERYLRDQASAPLT